MSGILEQRLFEWLEKKYVQRADPRQQTLYMEAETHDLAREIARWVHEDRGEKPYRGLGYTGVGGCDAAITVPRFK